MTVSHSYMVKIYHNTENSNYAWFNAFISGKVHFQNHDYGVFELFICQFLLYATIPLYIHLAQLSSQ